MKRSQLITVILLALLLIVNRRFTEPSSLKSYLGGLPWYGWAGFAGFLVVAGAVFALCEAYRARRLLEDPPKKHDVPAKQALPKEFEKYDVDGPDFPHPVIIAENCIGCQACVDACPHDVLTIENNIAKAVARDQCMEDTSCQVACPINPPACFVVHTTKKIPPRPSPKRSTVTFMAEQVPGCYIIGDVSGNPLIKYAANEGARVIEHIVEELKDLPPQPEAEFDVAIIGIGPAGLSAAIRAKKQNLRYIGIEQNKVLSTIDAYPKDKDIFFKPDTVDACCDIPFAARGAKCGEILESWLTEMRSNDIVINEGESCKAVKKAEDGDYFRVETRKGAAPEPHTYSARRVILALGKRGAPRLGVCGEDRKVMRNGRSEDRVLYALSNPDSFRRRKILVVGGGNSAVEAAVALVGKPVGNTIEFLSSDEANEVTLAVRSGFTNDLKLENKQRLYRCADAKRIRVVHHTTVKRIDEHEVVLMDARTEKDTEKILNDDVLALIGFGFPTEFLKGVGITIPQKSKPSKGHSTKSDTSPSIFQRLSVFRFRPN